jgi:hypothetical protein
MMTLIDTIYKKSLTLTEQQSIEVIDFIDFIKSRFAHRRHESSKTEREQALAHLDTVKINWEGKPIQNRDELYDNSRA